MDGEQSAARPPKIQTAAELMPSAPGDVAVLQSRHDALNRRDSGPQDCPQVRLLRVRLDADTELAIPTEYLDEVLVAADVTRVPHSPAAVAGVVSHRGAILAVIDLCSLIGLPPAAHRAEALVIVAVSGTRIALAVPEVMGMESVAESELAPPPNFADVRGSLLSAVLAGSVGVLDVSAMVHAISP